MRSQGVLLLGGPDAGKTNYLARLWLALSRRGGVAQVDAVPEDVTFVEGAVSHLLSGTFVPRSNEADGRKEFRATVEIATAEGPQGAHIVVPDVWGEHWSRAVDRREIDADWMDAMKGCRAALVFVRVLSDQLRQPLDWVNAAELLKAGLRDDSPEVPTQVFLSELLHLLEQTLQTSPDAKARVGVVVTAWDLLDAERAAKSPATFVETEFPMFAGRIADCDSLEIEVFGASVVGGDLGADAEFRARFQAEDPNSAGYVVFQSGGETRTAQDLTVPLAWILRGVDLRSVPWRR